VNINLIRVFFKIIMNLEVVVAQRLLDAILENCRIAYPRESILLLRGKRRGKKIEITDLIIPPLATRGQSFTSFPVHMLPIDFSIMGSVHSHPSGYSKPSVEDLNHFFGEIMMIVAYPFNGKENVQVFGQSSGERVLQVV
jgi:proteasome lid subunit RPN8/RPN11